MHNKKTGRAETQKKNKITGIKARMEAADYQPENIFVVDTSALEYSADYFEMLHQNGKNCVILPFRTWDELNDHKKEYGFRGKVSRSVVRRVLELTAANDPSIGLLNADFGQGMMESLRKENDEHRKIATAIQANRLFEGKRVFLVTKDPGMKVLGYHFGLRVYNDKEVFNDSFDQKIATINIEPSFTACSSFKVNDHDEKQAAVKENEGVICYTGENGNWRSVFMAIRKGHLFQVVEPSVSLFGVQPKSNNGKPNWKQFQAMAVLKDKSIPLVTLTGGAGTAKTFLAILAALEQSHEYKQILISRATVQLGNRDRLGYSPGNIEEKMRPWLLPIYDNLNTIKDMSADKKKKIEELFEKRKIEILDLDKIRGRSINKRFIIVDEIQNLPPEEVLAISTRNGEGTKMVLTGDVSPEQIDVPYLDHKSNGLSVLIDFMRGSELFANVYLDQAIRSPLVQCILERWERRNEQ